VAEAFKLLINPARVAHTAHHLRRAWPAFDAARFTALATDGLDALEFKARAHRLADALQATLPPAFDRALGVVCDALAPPLPLDAQGEPVGLQDGLHPDGIAGWALWGVGEWVVRAGAHDVPRALTGLHAITQRFTAEFAIRPFLAHAPEAVWPVLRRWVSDDSAHVRRLVSEGSRPRLPWGLRLHAAIADPTPALPLLAALQDDPSAYVRRSVANHLNDIAKDHPDRVADWVARHRPGASPAREALLRHASRSLVKQGHAPTLAAWGLTPGFDGEAQLHLDRAALPIGAALTLTATLRARRPTRAVVDLVVHHRRANGGTSPKVFKGWALDLPANEAVQRVRVHPLREVSTRRLYPGEHRVALQVNGAVVAEAAFVLHAADS